MLIAILASILLLCGVVAGSAYVLLRRIRDTEENVRQAVRSFVAAEGDEPSQLALVVDSIGQVLAARISTSLMASLRGAIGGVQKAVNSEAISEASEQVPMLGVLNLLAPKQVRKLGKNPAALSALTALFSHLGSGKSGSSSGNHAQTKLELGV